jgi:hemerythrin-like domain-containing protein
VQFRAPLMIEHRLIEKMIYIISKIINQAESTQIIDTRTVDVVVDFIKTYADKTHHGKEEDILFKDLSEKRMTDEDDKLMKELIEEHLFGRSIVRELVDSKNRVLKEHT